MSGGAEVDEVARGQSRDRFPVGTYDWVAALDDSHLSRHAKVLVLTLASFASPDGTSIRAGRRRIGRRSGLWNDDITAAHSELVERGWVEIEVEAAGTRPAVLRATLPAELHSGPASRTASISTPPSDSGPVSRTATGSSGPASGPGSGPASRTEPGTTDQHPRSRTRKEGREGQGPTVHPVTGAADPDHVEPRPLAHPGRAGEESRTSDADELVDAIFEKLPGPERRRLERTPQLLAAARSASQRGWSARRAAREVTRDGLDDARMLDRVLAARLKRLGSAPATEGGPCRICDDGLVLGDQPCPAGCPRPPGAA
jgi:hypothetical protein